jgi:predicted metal-dependent phosphoesterase TrpH
MPIVDLHCHSTASDGALSPAELVRYASEKGLEALALTDHDTCEGVPEARAEAHRLGLRFWSGVELNIAWGGGGHFHLLAYGVDEDHPKLASTLDWIQERRVARNTAILERMRAGGVDVQEDDLAALSRDGVAGRPHLAQLLVDRDVARDLDDAFRRFLGPGTAFYVKRETLGLEPALEAIHASGGIAVVAHPRSLRLDWQTLEERLLHWRTLGVRGIEAYHSSTPTAYGRRIEELARRLGLGVTAGSDFHRPGDRRVRLGRVMGRRKIRPRFAQLLDSALD